MLDSDNWQEDVLERIWLLFYDTGKQFKKAFWRT